MALRPIAGAPPGAPVPDSPTDPAEPPPDGVAKPSELHVPELIPGPNEIAVLLEQHRKRALYGGKIALEGMLASAKLLKTMYDRHGYRGERYEAFAIAHCNIRTKTDAHALYLLGEYADSVLAACEAEARLNSNYIWPGWRKVHADLRRELKKEQERTACAENPENCTDEEDEKPDPVVTLQRERDNLDRQVRAATQQFRNERARREEVEEQLAALREQLVGRDAQIAALRAQLAGKQQVGPNFILVGEVTSLKPRPRRARLLLPGPTPDPDPLKKKCSAGRPVGESRADTAPADLVGFRSRHLFVEGAGVGIRGIGDQPIPGLYLGPLGKNTDWRGHTLRMTDLLGQLGTAHYIKRDLQRYLPPGYPNPLRIQQHH